MTDTPHAAHIDDQAAPNADGEAGGAGEVWPVCSGASFNLWEPDTGDYYDSVDADSIREDLHHKRQTQHGTASSAFANLPETVTADPQTLPCLRPRIAFRDVSRSNDTRTFKCALIPPDRVLTHKAPYLLQTQGQPADEAYVLGVLSSMVFDWQVRRTAELNMTFAQLNQASIPDPGEGHAVRDRVTKIAARLAAAADRFAGWAAGHGVRSGPVPLEERRKLLAELDACVAVLYGLDSEDIAVLYDTFGRPGQYDARRVAVLAAMHDMAVPTGAAQQ